MSLEIKKIKGEKMNTNKERLEQIKLISEILTIKNLGFGMITIPEIEKLAKMRLELVNSLDDKKIF